MNVNKEQFFLKEIFDKNNQILTLQDQVETLQKELNEAKNDKKTNDKG